MSLREWLLKEGLSVCQSALDAKGVQELNDLFEFLDSDIHEIGISFGWNTLTRARMIDAVNKHRKEHMPAANAAQSSSSDHKKGKWKAAKEGKPVGKSVKYQSEINCFDEKIPESLKPEHESPELDSDLLRRMDEQKEVLATRKEYAKEYGGALTQLESSVEKLSMIDRKAFAEMILMKQPPKVLKDLVTAICMIFGMLEPSWEEATTFICDRDIRIILLKFEPKNVGLKARTKFIEFYNLNIDSFNPDRVEKINKKAVPFAEWVGGVNNLFQVFGKVERLPDGEKILEQKWKAHKKKNIIPPNFFRGVSLEFLREILKRDDRYGYASGNTLKALLTNPETKAGKCSFTELYEDLVGPSGKPLVGPIRYFVSHAWAYKFSNLVQAIEWFEAENHDRAGSYYFIDYFTINQWNPTEELKSLEKLIISSEALVLVTWPIKAPIPLNRCWCLYEIHISTKSNIPIHVAVPDDQRLLWRTKVLTSSDIDELLRFKIDSKNAKAYFKSDEEMIKTAIQKSGGFAELDKMVFTSVTTCIFSLALSELEQSGSQPLRDCLQFQIQSLAHQRSVELKRYEHKIEEERNPLLSFEEKEELKLCDASSTSDSLLNTDSNDCLISDLAQICSTCLGLVNDGKLFNVVSMILDWVGKCKWTVVTWRGGGDSSSVKSPLDVFDTMVSVKIYSTWSAFAVILKDKTVLTWGHKEQGGDSSSVKTSLSNVATIYSTSQAFAALLTDKTIVTWGKKGYGGDSSSVKAALRGVDTIYSTRYAFAAVLEDTTVVTWGHKNRGGDSSSVKAALIGVETIYSTSCAFAALRKDKTVVTWGDEVLGGDSSSVKMLLVGVDTIYSNTFAFAAVLMDKTIVTWGEKNSGGDSSNVKAALVNVDKIYSNTYAFAAVLMDKTVVTWGNGEHGGDSSSVKAALVDVDTIYSSIGAFVAVLKNKTVVTWGNKRFGGDASSMKTALMGVDKIYSTNYAFTAVLKDKTVVVWGGTYSQAWTALRWVDKIFSTSEAFAAVLKNKTVFTWGHRRDSREPRKVKMELRGVDRIYSNRTAFAAITTPAFDA